MNSRRESSTYKCLPSIHPSLALPSLTDPSSPSVSLSLNARGIYKHSLPFICELWGVTSVYEIYRLQLYAIASITLLYYDHLITFGTEVRRIWGKKLTLGTTLFLINRYVTFFGYFPVIIFFFDPPNNVNLCKNLARLGGYLSLITQMILTISLSMRIYALYNRSWIILVPLGTVGTAAVAASGWALSNFAGELEGFGGEASIFRTCLPAFTSSELSFKITFALTTIFDGIIFTLTLIKTFQIVRESERCGIQSGLLRLLVRDGSVYFATMTLANLINVIFYVKDPLAYFAQSTGNNSMLSHVISTTMFSRLSLNLHAYTGPQHTIHSTWVRPSNQSPRLPMDLDGDGTAFAMQTLMNTTTTGTTSGSRTIFDTSNVLSLATTDYEIGSTREGDIELVNAHSHISGLGQGGLEL